VKSKLRSSVVGHRQPGAFTLIELLVVMTIILILAGLILATSGYVQKKGTRSRTETEIAALSAALESYKADNGGYPRNNLANQVAPPWDPNLGPSQYPKATTGPDDLNANPAKSPANGDPSQTIYQYASRHLYEQLSGDMDLNLSPDAGKKSYFDFKPSMLWLIPDKEDNNIGLSYILDPFGNSYGYSTAYQADLDKTPPVNPPEHGYNPTFDLWSTGGVISTTSPPDQSQWIKNW
jgi:prepilin-type N-terminal cleavage/methylation domain-containing protein